MNEVPGTRPPDISVVLATYDRRHSLPRAIASVLAQDGVRFELIVVDDASRDGTADYLATLCDPRIRAITAERNGGPSAARNLGLKAARAGIVAFLDSDDAYLPRRLAAPLAAFATDAGLVCTLSSAIRHDRKRSREARIPAVRLAARAFEWALICDLVPVEATSITVRREAALAVGGFCERLRLIGDRRLHLWHAFWRDLGALRAAGLIDFDVLRLIRNHRAVRRYRRAMSGAEGLAGLAGPPAEWR